MPVIGLTGLIVAVYAAILGGAAVCAVVAPDGSSARTFGASLFTCAIITIAITYVEQLFMMRFLGNATREFVLSCDVLTNDCTVAGKHVGSSPVAKAVWQMPSAVAQLLAMAASFTTIYVVSYEIQAAEESRKPHEDTVPAAGRTAFLWLVVVMVLGYAAMQRFVTALQVGAGIALGTVMGGAGYALSAKMHRVLP